MKQHSNTLFFIFIMIGIHTFGQTTNTAKFSIEIDPITYVSRGYSLHLRFKPKNSQHLLLGLGTYAMDFPDALVNLNPQNKNMGWTVRLQQGYGLFTEYYFNTVNNKWFLGGQLALQTYSIEHSAVQSEFTNGLAMVYAGYVWQPFDFGLYFKPWAGLGYTHQLSGENTIETSTYDITPIMPFATLHLGYSF